MLISHPDLKRKPRCLGALVVAYINEATPVVGPAGLQAQMRAISRRALRDGTDIGLCVIESGGRLTASGRGWRLEELIRAAHDDLVDRVLYVADTEHLGTDPKAQLDAIRDITAAAFMLRAPCGRIAPNGRRAASLAARAVALARCTQGFTQATTSRIEGSRHRSL